jgi:hypothetical protein
MHTTDKPTTKPLISGTTVILYRQICDSLVAIHALPTETPLNSGNRHKDVQGRFSNQQPMSGSLSSVKIQFLLNGFLSIKMQWVRTFYTNLEIVSPDRHVVSGNLRQNFLLHDFFHITVINENSLC